MKPSVNIAPDTAIVVLTGAGVSAESGLDTFRTAGGLWSRYNVEDVATPQAFARDPQAVYDFYNMRYANAHRSQVKPNAAHAALARLEAHWPGPVTLVTQNVDSLHEQAGSQNLLHMHGEVHKTRCNACGEITPRGADYAVDQACPTCGTAGPVLRPHIVWFGETPLYLDHIQTALDRCGLFISLGTSGNVYPAAGFVSFVQRLGRAHTVELNLEPSEGAPRFAEAHYGPATDVVPAYVDALLAGV